MKKGMVYKIELKDEIYIGSTETLLCQRQGKHQYDLEHYPNRKLYKKCIEQGIDRIKCIWVADIEFITTAEKRMKEEEYRKELNATLNSYRCYRTETEKKEQLKKTVKEYRETHKEDIAERSKEYREKNKAKLAQLRKEYYEKNREEICAKNYEKIECPKCKSIIMRQYLSRHKKTKKCINLSNNE